MNVMRIAALGAAVWLLASGAGQGPAGAGGSHDGGGAAKCRVRAKAVFWTASDWALLGEEAATETDDITPSPRVSGGCDHSDISADDDPSTFSVGDARPCGRDSSTP